MVAGRWRDSGVRDDCRVMVEGEPLPLVVPEGVAPVVGRPPPGRTLII